MVIILEKHTCIPERKRHSRGARTAGREMRGIVGTRRILGLEAEVGLKKGRPAVEVC